MWGAMIRHDPVLIEAVGFQHCSVSVPLRRAMTVIGLLAVWTRRLFRAVRECGADCNVADGALS